jgi:hypothetical protein
MAIVVVAVVLAAIVGFLLIARRDRSRGEDPGDDLLPFSDGGGDDHYDSGGFDDGHGAFDGGDGGDAAGGGDSGAGGDGAGH